MSLVLIGKDLLLEAKQRTNGFQEGKDLFHKLPRKKRKKTV